MPASKDPKKEEERRKKISLGNTGRPSWNKGLTKETDERVAKCANRSREGDKKFTRWNKGLTKETDPRVARCGNRTHNRENNSWSKGLTKETDTRVKKISESNIGKHSHRKGLSFEEEYGEERAEEIKEKISQKLIALYEDPEFVDRYQKGHESFIKASKGKTLEEIYGEEEGKRKRKRIKLGRIKRLKEHPEEHPTYILSRNKGRMTKIEKLTKEFLERLGFKIGEDFVYQYLVACSGGTRWIDFYFPKLKLGIECDGAYWHQDRERDEKRDEEILKVLGEGSIIERLTEKEIFGLRYLQGVKHV